MDGYAVRAEDTFGAGTHAPQSLRLVDRVFTGRVPARGIGQGECIEIATGAPMPTARMPSSWWKRRNVPSQPERVARRRWARCAS